MLKFTTKMDASEARVKYKNYLHWLRNRPKRSRPAPEDVLTKDTLRWASQGHAVLDVVEAIRMGGLDAAHRPNLALARAHWTEAWLDTRGAGGGAVTFKFAGKRWTHSGGNWRSFIDLGAALGTHHVRSDTRAMVPTVPPHLRPSDGLENYLILWEANWLNAPPVDPLLLKRIGGTVCAVIAHWDLTPIEAMVLGACRRA